MKYVLVLALFFLFQNPADAQRVRRLLIFASDSTNIDLQAQRQWLDAERAGLEKRDIWLAIFDDPKKFRRMYEHYEVGKADFHIVLVGKDFQVKFRSDEPVNTEQLFALIDNLILTQEETEGRAAGN